VHRTTGNMAPTITESSMLTSYLLEPASLPTVLPYPQFVALFPSQHRSNPQIKLLYRDLQFLRTVDMDVVQENIAAECKRGDRMKVEMLRQLHADGKRQGESGDQREVEMDVQLFGPAGSLSRKDRRHTMDSLLHEMEHTCHELEAETQHAEAEAEEVLRHMKETVGALSDLRYGKFAKAPSMEVGGMEGEVVKALKGLEEACNQV
jgi:centromere-localized protein 2